MAGSMVYEFWACQGICGAKRRKLVSLIPLATMRVIRKGLIELSMISPLLVG